MAKQDDCKHEGQEGVFCGLCGKELRDPDAGLIEDAVERVLGKHGLIKLKKGGNEPPPRGNLLDRLKDKKK